MEDIGVPVKNNKMTAAITRFLNTARRGRVIPPAVVYLAFSSPSAATAGVFLTRKSEAHLSTIRLIPPFKDVNLSNSLMLLTYGCGEQISLQVERLRSFYMTRRGETPSSTSSVCSFLRHSFPRMFPLLVYTTVVVYLASRPVVELFHSCFNKLRKGRRRRSYHGAGVYYLLSPPRMEVVALFLT